MSRSFFIEKKLRCLLNFMKNKNAIVFFLIAVTAFFSCSTKKDTFVSRTYNSITTKYNILYNGNLAFQEGLDKINQQHKDNFWEQLFIEPITFEEKPTSIASFGGNPGPPGSSNTEDKALTTFDKAEEKAVKAIQLHSMNIGGRERNNQIDEAYLLLGKSRYYTQRFVPAIEAFNYVIINYPYADLIDETRIWRAKTNIRLDNDELAIESLKIVLSNEKLAPKTKEEAHTALAMAYVKNDSIQKAIQQLTLATNTQINVSQAARNLFILGQIYNSESKKDSAAVVFQKLINFKKAPYKFKIYANIDLAKTTTKDSSVTSLISKFKKLIKERENRKYLDALYYQKGLLEEKRDSLHLALEDFKMSLAIPDGDNIQKTYTYEKLGDIAFDFSQFVKAGAYYDSIIQISENSTDKRIRQIRRKYKSLAALIDFERVLKTNDSVLKLADLSRLEQITFFKEHIESLKKADEAAAKQQLVNSSFGSSFSGGSSIKSTNKGKWYFYNTQSLNFGKSEFEKTWGNRPLEDNWRISNKQQIQVTTADTKKTATVSVPKYNLNTYLDALPKTKSDIDSLVYNRNEALYQTGVIYKEQFKNVDLAILRLERLLKENPDRTLILPTKYHLYQLYLELNNPKAQVYKDGIIKEYPSSKYAEILLNKPKKQDDKKISQTEAIYKELYYIYKEDKFADVVSQIIELEPEIKDSNLIAKFELLKAMAIGKYQSKKAYLKALEYVSFNFGNTKEGQRAKEIINQLN